MLKIVLAWHVNWRKIQTRLLSVTFDSGTTSSGEVNWHFFVFVSIEFIMGFYADTGHNSDDVQLAIKTFDVRSIYFAS